MTVCDSVSPRSRVQGLRDQGVEVGVALPAVTPADPLGELVSTQS